MNWKFHFNLFSTGWIGDEKIGKKNFFQRKATFPNCSEYINLINNSNFNSIHIFELKIHFTDCTWCKIDKSPTWSQKLCKIEFFFYNTLAQIIDIHSDTKKDTKKNDRIDQFLKYSWFSYKIGINIHSLTVKCVNLLNKEARFNNSRSQ